MADLALLGPDCLDTLTLGSCLVPIALCAVEALPREAFVHIALDIIAGSHGLDKEALGVAFVEGGHDFLAV